MATTTIPHSVSTTRRDDVRASDDGSTPAHELALATRLYHAIACGHGRLAFNIAGTFPLWRRATSRRAAGQGGASPWRSWEAVPGCERVPDGEWRPCLEVRDDGTSQPRRFNPYLLAGHVRGRYDVAPHAPSWCAWWWFDIDAQIEHALRHDDSDDVIPSGAFRRALADRDARLAEVWRVFRLGPGREPVIMQSPGLGLHVGFPLTRGPLSPIEHTWPAKEIEERVAGVLREHGVQLADGRLELYPAARPLRAPCGRGSVLLRAARPDRPGDLGLAPVPETVMHRMRRTYDGERVETQVRRPWRMVAAFLEQWEATRRPLDEWLGDATRAWSPAWGPFENPDLVAVDRNFAKKIGAVGDGGDRGSQHIDEGQGGPVGREREPLEQGRWRERQPHASRSGSDPRSASTTPAGSVDPIDVDGSPASLTSKLRRGREFRQHLAQLLRCGVISPSTRHDAVLSLVFWWHVTGQGEQQVRAELEAWARAHQHVSRLKGERFVRTCLREGMHYYHRIKKLPQRARALIETVTRQRALAPADFLVLAQVREDVREEVWAILEYLHGHADRDGRVRQPVTLGRAQLESCVVSDRRVPIDGRGRHRAEVVAVRELERLGVLTVFCNYSTGHHGRIFSCWYAFGSGVLPTPREPGTYERSTRGTQAPADALVVAERELWEGTLRVLCDGTRRRPWVELEPGERVAVEEGGGASWWRKLFEGRHFTVGEFYDADRAVVIGGPWTRPPITTAYGALVEDLPPLVVRGSYDPSATREIVSTDAIATARPAPAPIAVLDARAELAAHMGDVADELDPDLAEAIARACRTWRERS